MRTGAMDDGLEILEWVYDMEEFEGYDWFDFNERLFVFYEEEKGTTQKDHNGLDGVGNGRPGLHIHEGYKQNSLILFITMNSLLNRVFIYSLIPLIEYTSRMLSSVIHPSILSFIITTISILFSDFSLLILHLSCYICRER